MRPLADAVAILGRLELPGVVSAYIFGSVARGLEHADSDLDVGLLFDRAALSTAAGRRDEADRVRTRLMEALHLDRVDVVVLNDAPPELAKTVVHTGAPPVVCRDDAVDRAFQRDAQLRYADLRPFLERTRRLKLDTLAR
jgi:predicted nucleotidyltransferase